MTGLEKLQVGDKAFVTSRGEPVLVTVEKVTKTQITAWGRRFNKNTGYLVGGDTWDTNSLELATPALVRQAMLAKHRRRAKTALYEAGKLLEEGRPADLKPWAELAAKWAEDWAALEAAEEVDCRHCVGAGVINQGAEKCPTCHGAGRVWEE